ncbi:DUF4126 domain-containing protein [Leucobacter sp. M11]|uniref:DUF4126 domain-containing protein n=1 Tax=Leucobacter sp. M11 TaxID=2993565 RepID=UPI002D80C304|nr:DUF4126 domain-containing protein [Leucobacter sp. M11]MEB4613058.1 DUF4126 domain-containing protein [Leucobacter sp. M11]
MLELLTGAGLAAAAGLNAYIPLLGLGLLAKFTPLVTLPSGWDWLTNDWVMIVFGVLLVIELFVDKVPGLDTVNDVLSSVIRPAAGGMVFAAGTGSETVAVSDPEAFVNSSQFWPVIIGVGIALVPHLLKAVARPALNAVSVGVAAPVASTAEDGASIALTLLAVLVPVLGALLAVLAIWLLIRRLRRALRSRRARKAATASPSTG